MALKELIKSAQEKGFEPKTFSTKWTFDVLLGVKKDFFVNEQCISILLAEIQWWSRGEHKLDVFCDCIGSGLYFAVIYINDGRKEDKVFEQRGEMPYEEALILGLKEAIKLIP